MVSDRVAVLPAILVLLLTACGSTLQQVAAPTVENVPQQSGDGLSVEPAPQDTAAPDPGAGESMAGEPVLGGESGSSPAVGSGRDAGSGTGGSGSTGGETTGSGPATPRSTEGAGSTSSVEEPIRIGILLADIGALTAIFGSDEDGDVSAMHRAFIEYLNGTGGIAGRMVEGEFVTVDIAADYNAEGQRACEVFAQDNPVDIVFPMDFSNEVLLACLARHGIPALDTNIWTNDRGHLDHPNWFTPLAMRVDRYAIASIDVAVEQGTLQGGDKLGVLFEDCPWGGRVYRDVVQPAASRHGVETEQATVKCIENLVSDLGPVTNQSRSAVLRFRSAGVTHVLVLSAAEGFVVSQFASAASDQRWYPNYLLTSNAWPDNNATPGSAIAFPRDQVPNMSGIGFVPYRDVGERARPANDAQAAVQAECRNADPSMNGAEGYDQGTDRTTRIVGFYATCDVYFTLRNLGDATGGRLSTPDVASVYTDVLARSPSAWLVTGRFGPSAERRDGVGFVQPFMFDSGLGRFAYSGTARPV